MCLIEIHHFIDKTFLTSTTISINHNPPLISIVILWFERNSYRTKKNLLHWLSGKLPFENMHMLKLEVLGFSLIEFKSNVNVNVFALSISTVKTKQRIQTAIK